MKKGFIFGLQSEKQGLEGTINTLNASVTDLQSDKSGLEGEIETLKDGVKALEDELKNCGKGSPKRGVLIGINP